MQVVCFVFFCRLVVDYQTCSSEDFSEGRSSEGSKFSDFPSDVVIFVVRDLGDLEILLMLLLKLAELLFVAY